MIIYVFSSINKSIEIKDLTEEEKQFRIYAIENNL
jgi:hypothetical protein